MEYNIVIRRTRVVVACFSNRGEAEAVLNIIQTTALDAPAMDIKEVPSHLNNVET